jgi:hypothetical protein
LYISEDLYTKENTFAGNDAAMFKLLWICGFHKFKPTKQYSWYISSREGHDDSGNTIHSYIILWQEIFDESYVDYSKLALSIKFCL